MPNIREIARLCGVSTSTVSNVLHGRTGRVGAETREKVLRVVRELRYRPPAMEDRQKAIRTYNLGVLVDDISESPVVSNVYFQRVLDGVVEQGARHGYTATIFVAALWADPLQALRRHFDGRCDGMILVGGVHPDTVIKGLYERGIPMVTVGRSLEIPGVSNIDVDNRSVGYQATRYLLGLGHRDLAFVGYDPGHLSSLERANGFRQALHEFGLPEGSARLCPGAFIEHTGNLAVQAMVRQGALPTALVCASDPIAFGAIDELGRLGLSVPKDVSVIGVDDIPDCIQCDPPLTTIRQPLQVMGKRAVQQLIDKVESPDYPDESVTFSFEMIERASCAKAPSSPRRVTLVAAEFDPTSAVQEAADSPRESARGAAAFPLGRSGNGATSITQESNP